MSKTKEAQEMYEVAPGIFFPVVGKAKVEGGGTFPVVDIPMVSDYKWQLDCLNDRLEHPEKYAAFEDVEERILHLKKWLLDHAESKEQERAVLSLFK